MSNTQWAETNRQAAARVPRLDVPLAICVLLGMVGFVLALRDGMRAWQTYWVNFLFWAGIAQAGVVLAALVHLTQGRWGGALVRLGLLQAAFLPLTMILYVGIALIAPHLLPWVATPVPEKAWWLNLMSFLLRDGIASLALVLASAAFAYFVLRPDAGALAQTGPTPYPVWLTRHWRGEEAERERSRRALAWLAPLLILLYCVVYTLVGFDMIMTLDPHWYSTLFGAYYFITTMYLGIAALAILGALVRRRLRLEEQLDSPRFHDLGKLLFAFCFLSGDFFWSQYLVIWYGDLPEEISFILQRTQCQPWLALSLIVLFGGFVIPFTILLNRRIKQIPAALAVVALLVLVVGFGERILLIVPSLHPESDYRFPFGIPEIFITVGFGGLYGLSLLWALRRAPLVPPGVSRED
jgi:Ni/Fe-hydrogenase subunit HybB-like protein